MGAIVTTYPNAPVPGPLFHGDSRQYTQKFVPVKRGLWFRVNCERLRFPLILYGFTFLAYSCFPGSFGVIFCNILFKVSTIDPEGPPIARDENGKIVGVIFE